MTAPDKPYTPPADAFRPHTWVPSIGWSYALHPVDQVDDPYRRRVTVKAPHGECFVGWIGAGTPTMGPRLEALNTMGAEWLELAEVSLVITDAQRWIEQRENPKPCRFLLQTLPLQGSHGRQGSLF